MLAADRSRKFEEILAAYLEATERGESPDRAALLRAHPDIADPLREFFANEKQLAAAGLGAGPIATRTIGSRIGEYEILGEIARGGMGIVFRARHVRLQRVVALKMMLGGEFAGSDGLRRFRTEAEVVAALDHPHIVPVYDVGETDGHPYYAMKLVDGPSLKERIGDFVGKPDEAARVIIAVARAVHHAHQRGILHRDLKPGNILLARHEAPKRKADKYPVAGIPQHAQHHPRNVTPFVTDFGLAKRFSNDGLASQSTAVVGTAAYMAPEQATGKQALSVAADVYSLGAMLFELLTGRPPFVGQNQMEVMLQAIEKEPPSPVQFQPELDPDLAQVSLKCLRKNPDERYSSAEALAEELEHWLEGEPLAVRAPTAGERIARWSRRHPWALLATCIILLLSAALVAGSVGVSWHLNDLNQQLLDANEIADAHKRLAEKKAETETTTRIDAEKARNDAEKAKLELQDTLAQKKAAHDAELRVLERRRQLLVQQYVANGKEMTQRGDVAGAAVWFASALEQDQGDPEREFPHRVRLGTALRQLPTLAQTSVLNAKPRFVRLSPTGDRLLIVRKDAADLRNAKTGERVGTALVVPGTISAAEFSPDGRFVGLAGSDGAVQLFEAQAGKPHAKAMSHAAVVHGIAFSHDSATLATAAADKAVRFWETATGKSIGKTLAHEQEARFAAFHPLGKKLITIAETIKNKKGEVRLWDVTAGASVLLSTPVMQGVLAAGFSRDGQRIFAVGSNHKLFLWQLSGQPITPTTSLYVKGDVGWMSPAADRLLQPVDNEVKVVDVPKGSTVFALPHESPAYLAQFSSGGRYIVTATANRGVRLWRASTGQQVGQPIPSQQLVSSIHFSRDERWLAIVAEDHCIRLWDLSTLESAPTLLAAKAKSAFLSLSPDGGMALFTQGKSVYLWDTNQAKQVGAVLGIAGAVTHTAWSPDGRTVAIATREEARVFEARTSIALAPALKLDKMDDAHLHHALSGDVAIWNPAQVRVWDSAGKPLWQRKLTKQMHVLECDGRRLALWRNKGTLEIIDGRSDKGKPLLKLGIVPSLFRFSPDGRLGVAGFADGSLRIWDLATGKPTTLPFWHGSAVRRIAWSMDGRLLASSDAMARVRIWESATGLPLTPLIEPLGESPRFAFSSDSQALLIASSDGTVQRLNLAPQPGDPADLVRLATLTAGQELHDASGSLIPIEAARLQELWHSEP